MTNISDQELELLRGISDLLTLEPVVRVGNVVIENIGGPGGPADGMPNTIGTPRVTPGKLAELTEKAKAIRRQGAAAGTVMNILTKIITSLPRFVG